MPRYTATLSAKSFRKLAKKVRDYRKSLPEKCEEFAYRLAEEGVAIAQLKILSFDAVMSGDLLNSMNLEAGDIYSDGAKYYIYTDCEWAQFVEFGTGIEGAENPHPDTGIVGWKYDIKNHGEEGWYYYKDGKWHWTKGMPSRPFMYETGKELKDMGIIMNIAKDVFSDDRCIKQGAV